MEYAIGTKFLSGGKHKRECIVTDILKTYNSAGDLVKTRYQASHEFMGQIVTDYDVVAITIAKNLIERV
jgi:L,D-peptidoglycan transpeptidase YkuD (ErfK/YbiS/YcfS/YnhG family)